MYARTHSYAGNTRERNRSINQITVIVQSQQQQQQQQQEPQVSEREKESCGTQALDNQSKSRSAAAAAQKERGRERERAVRMKSEGYSNFEPSLGPKSQCAAIIYHRGPLTIYIHILILYTCTHASTDFYIDSHARAHEIGFRVHPHFNNAPRRKDIDVRAAHFFFSLDIADDENSSMLYIYTLE